MYFMVSLELFRLLYVRVRAGRQTLFLFATAMVIWLDYHCTYGVIDGHVLKQALTTLVASRVAAQPHD
jgi:hypothetical protein